MTKVREDYDKQIPSVWKINQILARIDDQDDVAVLANLFEEAKRFESELKTLKTIIDRGLGVR